MSTHHHNTTDVLQSDIVPANRRDPTGTGVLRDRYARKLRAAYARINTEIREGIAEQDRFALAGDVLDLPPEFQIANPTEKERLFMDWLERRLDEEVFEVVDRTDNTFIRSAYSRGLKDADRALRENGIEIGEVDIQAVFNQGDTVFGAVGINDQNTFRHSRCLACTS